MNFDPATDDSQPMHQHGEVRLPGCPFHSWTDVVRNNILSRGPGVNIAYPKVACFVGYPIFTQTSMAFHEKSMTQTGSKLGLTPIHARLGSRKVRLSEIRLGMWESPCWDPTVGFTLLLYNRYNPLIITHWGLIAAFFTPETGPREPCKIPGHQVVYHISRYIKVV